MTYRITMRLNDGRAEPPPFDVTLGDGIYDSLEDVGRLVGEELANDNGVPFGVGVTVTVERVA